MLNQCPKSIEFDVYEPRNPKASAYYRCVEDHFEELETVWLPAPLPARRLPGRRVEPKPRRENLAHYIIRAYFSQERMTYIAANDSSDGVAKVIYQSKDGTSTKTFDALDCPNAQFHLKKLRLTIKSAFVIWIVIGSV